MRTVFIQTLGCRTNQYDSAAVLHQLEQDGFVRTDLPEKADICIINTCTVTARADAKSRQVIGKTVRACGERPVIVVGCGPQNNADMFRAIPGVRKVFGIHAVHEIRKFLSLPTRRIAAAFGPVPTRGAKTRAQVKIQEGCDSFCTYCIVPMVRGKPVSRPFSDVLRQVGALVHAGCPEIVFTGIHIGRYADAGKTLDDVVAAAADLPGNFRVRISSIEPQEISPRLIDLTVGHEKVCNHLHISFQSGDDAVLKLMGRRYSAAAIFSLLEKIRVRDPLFGLGADFIVGFNGETEERFQSTLKQVAGSALTYGHVFPFSMRKGTAAERLPGPVTPGEKNRRCRELKDVLQKNKQAFFNANLGKRHVIACEDNQTGVTTNYIRVRCKEPVAQGLLVPVIITGCSRDSVQGTINREGRDGAA